MIEGEQYAIDFEVEDAKKRVDTEVRTMLAHMEEEGSFTKEHFATLMEVAVTNGMNRDLTSDESTAVREYALEHPSRTSLNVEELIEALFSSRREAA